MNRTDKSFRMLYYRSSFKLTFSFRRHPYLTISAPAIPPAPEAPFPGPGAYEICGFKEVEKKYMSSAAFVSNTSRWAIDTTAAAEQPGPASYTPRTTVKQSFNFNFVIVSVVL